MEAEEEMIFIILSYSSSQVNKVLKIGAMYTACHLWNAAGEWLCSSWLLYVCYGSEEGDYD
jgi:hypothetical protein